MGIRNKRGFLREGELVLWKGVESGVRVHGCGREGRWLGYSGYGSSWSIVAEEDLELWESGIVIKGYGYRYSLVNDLRCLCTKQMEYVFILHSC